MKQFFKHVRLLAIFVLVAAGIGCASVPPPNFTPSSVGIIKQKAPANLKAISVAIAQPNEQVGKKVAIGQLALVAPAWADVPGFWKNALENALIRANAFDGTSPKQVSILVKVLEYWQPGMSAEFPTTVTAQYDIVDTANGAILFTSVITTVGKTEMGHAFVGATRALESQNRGVQMNIIQFIQQLEGADLSRTVIPGRKTSGL